MSCDVEEIVRVGEIQDAARERTRRADCNPIDAALEIDDGIGLVSLPGGRRTSTARRYRHRRHR